MGSIFISDKKIKDLDGKIEGKYLYMDEKKYIIVRGEPKGIYVVEV